MDHSLPFITAKPPLHPLDLSSADQVRQALSCLLMQLQDLLIEPAPLEPAAATAYDIVSICAGFIALNSGPKFRDEFGHLFTTLDTSTADGVCLDGFVRAYANALTPVIETVAITLQMPELGDALSDLRLIFWQVTLPYLDQDLGRHPAHLAGLCRRLLDGIDQRQPEQAVQAVLRLKDKLASAPVFGEYALLLQDFDPFADCRSGFPS